VLGHDPREQTVGQLLAVGARLVTTRSCSSTIRPLSRDWTSTPPAIDLIISPGRAGSASGPVSSSRRFFLAANTARAASSASGAITTSVKMRVIASAAARRAAG
jgi:hypothetical protein